MTRITIEAIKDKDFPVLKNYLESLGLKYQVNGHHDLLYNDEVKNTLDERFHDCQKGTIGMVCAEESQKKIQALLADKSK